jgi:hypothetical protein
MTEVRKIVTHIDETLIEGGRAASVPMRLFAVAAVLRNPWAGKGFVDQTSGNPHLCWASC